MYIPPGFNTITPYFFVKGADQFVAFLVKAFGGIEVLRSLRPDGCIANTQVRIGTSTIMASEAGGVNLANKTAAQQCKTNEGHFFLQKEGFSVAKVIRLLH